MRLALAQIDVAVGALDANEDKIVATLADARDAGAQLVLFPELAVSGYPPEDLLLKGHFLEHTRETLERIAAQVHDVVAVVGFPELAHDAFNSAAVLADGAVRAIYRKVHLPNYGVFDEQRYFQSGPGPALLDVGGTLVGLTICEDVWQPGEPASAEALAGATLLVNLSASPYDRGKPARREQMVRQRALDNVSAFAFCNLVGGQDELVFDGHSFVCDHAGTVLARAPGFAEHLLVCDVDPSAAAGARLRDTRQRPAARALERVVPVLARVEPPPRSDPESAATGGDVVPFLDDVAEVYAALVLGLRDYVEKNGFAHVVLGLSGGIDSARWMILDSHQSVPDPVNAIEKVLIDRNQKPSSLVRLWNTLKEKGFQISADADLVADFPDLKLAEPYEWTQPYLNKTIAFKVVDSLEIAIGWINRYSSGHADCIATESYLESRQFALDVNSASTFINASPRFWRYQNRGDAIFLGMSNQKGYRRGLIGLDTLTTIKEIVQGNGLF
jgi:predicted amidohydrolase